MKYRAAGVAIFFLFSLAFVYPREGSTTVSTGTLSAQQRRSQTERRRGSRAVRPATPRIDYSSFSHRTPQHQRACDACHKFPSPNWKEVRKGDAAFPDITQYPQHASCIGCHQQQFFNAPQPVICSVCHTNISPRNHERYPFPSLGATFYASKKGRDFTSDFHLNFPHDKHVEIVGQNRGATETSGGLRLIRASFQQETAAQAGKSCSVCHQTYQPQGSSSDEYVTRPPQNLGEAFWLKKGTFKTIPLTHATCFTCHSEEGGIEPALNACNSCHKLRASTAENPPADFDPQIAAATGVNDNLLLAQWRRRHSSGTFRHEGGAHPDQSCTDCHQVAKMNTLDERTLRVPVLSCGGCHAGATADDGALNFEVEKRKADPGFQCVKCHVRFGREPVPESHLKAIAAAQTK
jgi:hypothetical protein